jgi:hypothetical protein
VIIVGELDSTLAKMLIVGDVTHGLRIILAFLQDKIVASYLFISYPHWYGLYLFFIGVDDIKRHILPLMRSTSRMCLQRRFNSLSFYLGKIIIFQKRDHFILKPWQLHLLRWDSFALIDETVETSSLIMSNAVETDPTLQRSTFTRS